MFNDTNYNRHSCELYVRVEKGQTTNMKHPFLSYVQRVDIGDKPTSFTALV